MGTSDYHPMLVIGGADGSVRWTNSMRGALRLRSQVRVSLLEDVRLLMVSVSSCSWEGLSINLTTIEMTTNTGW
jgi:hypothetical protein